MKKSPFINIEKALCRMFEKEEGIFMRNGTTALWVLLKALGLKKKKVVVPVNICFVVPLAILLSGNEPYFVDIGEDFTIDTDELKKINSGTVKAVIFPYMYGNTGNIYEVMKICKKKGWILIEDTAQSLGAKISGRYAGSFTDFSMTSFGMGKIIDVNIGGVLCLNSAKLQKEAIKIYNSLNVLNEKDLVSRQHFSQFYFLMADCIENGEGLHRFGAPLADTYKDCFLSRIGSGLSFLPILENKIRLLGEELNIRNENAGYFQELIKHKNAVPVSHAKGATYWRQNILAKNNRGGLLKYLRENKVKASKYFPSIDRFFYPRNGREFPVSDLMSEQIINLWPGRETARKDIVRINELINQFYRG